jgi:uncharacterized protein
MADYFLDTSALVKRHVNEVGSAWMRSLTRPKAAHTLYIARITAVEVYSAITRRQRGRHLSPAQAGAMLGHFRRHLSQRYNVLEVTPTLFTGAMLAARKPGLRAYDAIQLTVALELDRLNRRADFGSVTLLSSDRDLNVAASAEGLTVDDPTAHP